MRVAITRTIAVNLEIIFFDKQTSALDPELISEALSVIKKLADEGMTMIVVTHEMNFAKNVSTKTLFMEDGQIIEEGDSKLFFNNPIEERIRIFFQKINNSVEENTSQKTGANK